MLGVVIVNYKNELRTIQFVQEELIKISQPYICVIVNNASIRESDLSLCKALKAILVTTIQASIPPKKDQLFVIKSDENIGFARANNLAVAFLRMHFKIDFLLFTNNDIRFINNDVVEKLQEKLSILDDAALIGPKVIGLQGEAQSPEPYRSLWNRWVWLYWLTPFISLSFKQKLFNLQYSQEALEGFHYKIMGSFFLMCMDDFNKIEGMDPHTFLYSEEIILSERLKQIGKGCYYDPTVCVLHEHGQTISKYLSKNKNRIQLFESECYYYKAYKGSSSFSILLVKFLYMIYSNIKLILDKIR